MEKDIGKLSKNQDTDIIIRIDDFGGKRGVTIREFVKGERYTGFTKAGTRIPAEKFKEFKAYINEINEKELMESAVEPVQQSSQPASEPKKAPEKKSKKISSDIEDQVM